MWVLRLSLQLGRLPHELEHALTAEDLALYQALVEIDGPFWGQRETQMIARLCSVVAATAGANLPPDEFEPEWTVGPAGDAPAGNLLPPADGLALLAARYGFAVAEELP